MARGLRPVGTGSVRSGREIDVALWAGIIDVVGAGGRQLVPAGDAIDEVWVGDETPSERNGVAASLGEGLVRLSRLVTVIDDQRAREPLPTQCLVVDRPCRQTERVAVRESERVKRSQQGAECLLRIVVVEIN